MEKIDIQALIQDLADAGAREAAIDAQELTERAAAYLDLAAETITAPGAPLGLVNWLLDLRDEVLKIRDVLSLAYHFLKLEEVHDGS